MPAREHAALLLRKAGQDEFVLAKLAPDPASPDEVLGFHAQQAVEKLLKAVLAAAEVSYRYTHDLVELIDLLAANGIAFPEDLEEVTRLTPFATALRYDDLPDEAEQPLDATWVVEVVRRTRVWAESVIDNSGPPGVTEKVAE